MMELAGVDWGLACLQRVERTMSHPLPLSRVATTRLALRCQPELLQIELPEKNDRNSRKRGDKCADQTNPSFFETPPKIRRIGESR